MLYRVYVWKRKRTVVADIVRQVFADSEDEAIQTVLTLHSLAQVYYVWVVSPVDEEVNVNRYHVSCAHRSLPTPRKETR